MGHAGKCRALKSLKAVVKIFEYLEAGLHPNHRHYKQPDKLRARGLRDAQQFPIRCEQMFDAWHRQNRLHTGRKPKVRALWWMPRFADRVVLSQEEKSLVEKRLLTVLPKGVLIVYNWHLPLPVELGRRPKGPDFNFLFSNLTRGVLPQLSRDSKTSHWGILTKAMDNVVDELNANRRRDYNLGLTKDLNLISTMAAAKARRKKRRPLPLCEQLACLPNAGDSLAELHLALAELGYVYTPARNAGSGYVRRRHCPVLQTGRRKHRFKGQGYFISEEQLLDEVQRAIQKRAKNKAMTAVAPAATRPSPASPASPAAPATAPPASVPPTQKTTTKLYPPVPSTAPNRVAPAPASAPTPGASPSPTPPPPSPKPPAHPTTAPKANSASPALTAEPTKNPASAVARTMKPATQTTAAPKQSTVATQPPALDRKQGTSKSPAAVVTEVPAGQAMSPEPRAGSTPPAQKTAPAPTMAPSPGGPGTQTLSRQPTKAPAKSSAAPAKPKTGPPSAPVATGASSIKLEARVKPPIQQSAIVAPGKATAATSSPASPTPIALTPAKAMPQETPPRDTNVLQGLAKPELSPEQQVLLANTLVTRVLSAITDRDPMPHSIAECGTLARRAGIVLKVSDEDTDQATLRWDSQQCDISTPIIQLAIQMEIIHARLPRKPRLPERDRWEYIADPGAEVKAKYDWLPLISNSWDKIEAALKDSKVKGAWIKASHEIEAGIIDDWACHLHQALTSADTELDVALLIVASQAPATVLNLEAIRTKINDRALSP